jgi:DNA damage-binding protein 2
VYDVLGESTSPIIKLPHPHRHFQHLTPIEGSWHPTLPSVFVIGRYPETGSNDQRTVDIFQTNGEDVRCIARIDDERVSGIQCLCKFNKTGDLLATCSGNLSN